MEIEKKLTALVIDDEEINRRILEVDLEDAGYDVILAVDGVDGWEKLEDLQHNINVILLDRMMPNMDGMQFLEKLKSSEEYKKIPVIMQTAAAEKNQVVEGINSGVYYYLTKPYEEEVLLSITKAAVDDYANQTELREKIKSLEHCFGATKNSSWEFSTLEKCQEMAAFVASYFPDPSRAVIGLNELFINAHEHGNLGISYTEKTELLNQGTWKNEVVRRELLPENKDKKIQVSYVKNDDFIELVIEDEGDGFDWSMFLDLAPDRATHNHGRGIALSKNISFDEMEYVGNGNKVMCRVFI